MKVVQFVKSVALLKPKVKGYTQLERSGNSRTAQNNRMRGFPMECQGGGKCAGRMTKSCLDTWPVPEWGKTRQPDWKLQSHYEPIVFQALAMRSQRGGVAMALVFARPQPTAVLRKIGLCAGECFDTMNKNRIWIGKKVKWVFSGRWKGKIGALPKKHGEEVGRNGWIAGLDEQNHVLLEGLHHNP